MNKKQKVVEGILDGLRSAESYAEIHGDCFAYRYLVGYISTVLEIEA